MDEGQPEDQPTGILKDVFVNVVSLCVWSLLFKKKRLCREVLLHSAGAWRFYQYLYLLFHPISPKSVSIVSIDLPDNVYFLKQSSASSHFAKARMTFRMNHKANIKIAALTRKKPVC